MWLFVVLILVHQSTVFVRANLCDSDVDCNDLNFERCQRYSFCSKGRCVCREGYNRTDTGSCYKVLKVGDACVNYTAPAPIQTITHHCGERVNCTGTGTGPGVCTCYGTKHSDYTCKALFGEIAYNELCTGIQKCEGNARCIDASERRCVCTVESTVWTTDKVYSPLGRPLSRCLHSQSKTGLKEGNRCDRLIGNDNYDYDQLRRHCAAKLVCDSCPEDVNSFFCMRAPFSGANTNALGLMTLMTTLLLQFYS